MTSINKNQDFAVLDVETRYSAQEVGGWHRADRMGVSIVVMYDSRGDKFTSYTQDQVPQMIKDLEGIPLVVGFNIIRFDYTVLSPHVPTCTFKDWETLDLLTAVHKELSHRLPLDNLAAATLGAGKSANGLMALKWWREKKLDLIEEYCQQDVAITKDLYLHGRDKGFVLYTDRQGQVRKVRAGWAI